MPRHEKSAEAAGRADLANQSDADAWTVAARENTQRGWNGGNGTAAPAKHKSCRRYLSACLFAVAYGLMLWNMGFLGHEQRPQADIRQQVWVACISSFVLFALVVAVQIWHNEIFVRSAVVGNEGRCCGCIKWSRSLGYLFLLVVVACLITLPFWVGQRIIDCLSDSKISCADQAGDIGFVSAGVFTVLAVLFGLREIVKHWLNYFKPQMQRHVVRVLWMVPIYAIDAIVTLHLCFGRTNKDGSRMGCDGDDGIYRLGLETLREFYEAYTIYAFFCYMVECLHEEGKQLSLEEQDDSAEGVRARMVAAQAAGAEENLQSALLSVNTGKPARRTLNDRVAMLPSGRLKGGFVTAQGMDAPEKLYQLLRDTNPNGMKHDWKWGLGWMKEWEMGEEWLEKCWRGVLQYVLCQVAFAVVVLITRSTDTYGEGCLMPWSWNNDDDTLWTALHSNSSSHGTVEEIRALNPDYRLHRCGQRAYPYTTFIISLSQMYALYCLVFFYHGTSKPLQRIKPLAKFISIKLIVFFSYWQGLGLSMVDTNTDLLEGPAIFLGLCQAPCDHGGTESLSTGIQAVLICVEMFCAALAHRTVFSYRDYRNRLTDLPELGLCGAAAHSLNNKVLVAMGKDYVRYEVGAVRIVADAAEQVADRVVDAAGVVGDHIVGGDRLLRESEGPSDDALNVV